MNMLAPNRRNSAPGTPKGILEDLIDALGEETTLVLIEKLGGTRVLIPSGARGLDPDGLLLQAIGYNGVAALMEWGEGTRLPVPLAREWRLGIYLRMNLARREMARRLGVTEKTVYALLARRSAHARQLSLPL